TQHRERSELRCAWMNRLWNTCGDKVREQPHVGRTLQDDPAGDAAVEVPPLWQGPSYGRAAAVEVTLLCGGTCAGGLLRARSLACAVSCVHGLLRARSLARAALA